MMPKTDSVNHPSHYTEGCIECIDAIKASMSSEAFIGYLKGNAMKYLWRYEKKDKSIEDLSKARWYVNRLLDELAPTPNTWGGDKDVSKNSN